MLIDEDDPSFYMVKILRDDGIRHIRKIGDPLPDRYVLCGEQFQESTKVCYDRTVPVCVNCSRVHILEELGE